MNTSCQIEHSTAGATLADLLERILDKGIVISGDIRIKLVEIELLTIQIRLLICSVDKAKEIGIDWWTDQRTLSSPRPEPLADAVVHLSERLAKLEGVAAKAPSV